MRGAKCNKEYKRRCKEKKSGSHEENDQNLQEEDVVDLLAADDATYTENHPWQCNVCKGILKDPVQIAGCLHQFCLKCIPPHVQIESPEQEVNVAPLQKDECLCPICRRRAPRPTQRDVNQAIVEYVKKLVAAKKKQTPPKMKEVKSNAPHNRKTADDTHCKNVHRNPARVMQVPTLACAQVIAEKRSRQSDGKGAAKRVKFNF